MAELARKRAEAHAEREKEIELQKIQAEEEAKKEEERLKEKERLEKLEKEKEIEEKRLKYKHDKEIGLLKTEKQKKQDEKDERRRQELLEIIKSQEQANEGKKDEKKKYYKKKKNKESEEQAEKKEEKDEVEEKKEEKKEEEEVDVEWEELANDPDKMDAIIRPKLSMDLTEVTADNQAENETEESKQPEAEQNDTQEASETTPESTPSKPEVKKEEEEKEPVQQPKKKKRGGKEERKKIEVRAPILCVLGHVDTGKTKILDKIRKTKVQEGEIGGITQQIGATYFPKETLESHAKEVKGIIDVKIKIPGFLIIDTPGHESFSNLRNRGSTLCDFAILIVDVMHGLENQTVESINILKKYKIPFVVALNKIDRCYDWKPIEYASSKTSYERNKQCQHQFNTLMNKVIQQFAEQEINVCLYWKNEDPESFISMVPTSAITGEGIPDLLTYVVKRIQDTLAKRIIYQPKFVSSVMEVKVLEGYGVTCDVILVTGELKINDIIILNGLDGPIVATIRALLTPRPLKEMRVKGEYIHHESVRGTIGVKVCAPGLDDALAGSPIYCAKNEDEVEMYKKQAGEELAAMIRKYISKTGEGIYVQSSTLGSLEALLELLKNNKVPVSGIGLGPLYKKHILKVMKASEKKGEKEEYATILAFEVEPDKEAKDLIEKNGIKIFTAKIVYHLIDAYLKHAEECS